METLTLILVDPAGVQARYAPIYRLYVAWSLRGGGCRVFGPFCLN